MKLLQKITFIMLALYSQSIETMSETMKQDLAEKRKGAAPAAIILPTPATVAADLAQLKQEFEALTNPTIKDIDQLRGMQTRVNSIMDLPGLSDSDTKKARGLWTEIATTIKNVRAGVATRKDAAPAAMPLPTLVAAAPKSELQTPSEKLTALQNELGALTNPTIEDLDQLRGMQTRVNSIMDLPGLSDSDTKKARGLWTEIATTIKNVRAGVATRK